MNANQIIEQYLASKGCCGPENNQGCSTAPFMNFDTHPNLREDQFEQAFFDRFIDKSQFLRDIRTLRVTECRGRIPRMNSCSIVTEGQCSTNNCNTTGLDLDISWMTYELKKYKSRLPISNDFLDCNKLGTPEFINSFLQNRLLQEHANNMALTAIGGNEDLMTGPGQPQINNLLGNNDGFLKLFCECTPECQIIDAKGMGPSRELYMAALQRMPNQFRRNDGRYQFIGPTRQRDWLTLQTSYRPTAKGDEACENGVSGRIWGMNFYELPEWPVDFDYGGKKVTHVVLTSLDNMVYIQRSAPRIDSRYDIDCDATLTVLRTESDFLVEDERQVVMIKNLDFDNCKNPWDGCPSACPTSECVHKIPNPCDSCPPEETL